MHLLKDGCFANRLGAVFIFPGPFCLEAILAGSGHNYKLHS